MDNVVTEETTDDFAGVPPSVQPPASYPKWPWVVAGILIAIGVFIAVAWPITVPYYTLSPGPVYDTSDFVTVEGGTVSDDGELFFLTVSLKEANIFEYAAAQIDPRVDIRERETVRPIGVSPEQLRRESLAAMSQSQQDAIFVALTQLGYEVTLIGTGALVIDTVPDAAADGILLPNDVIIEMNGQVVAFRDDIINQLGDLEIGDLVEMMIERPDEGSEDFDDLSVEIVLGPHVDDPTKPMIGILLDNNTPIVEFPVEVGIESQNIGGPSAGMMFTLQIMDQLTPGELTSGERIAGTGTISRDGTVGPIGGIKQKVYGAIDAGARAVLVPASNYDAAVIAAGDDIEVVRVETIEDSLEFLETL
ncbi:MAG: PDZ domain-containing protein [Actinomycetia bacterium]|nr:PDZ domain-containing protein [Actinomycetes bacterium]